jgi:atypical dual specificity phosphatase
MASSSSSPPSLVGRLLALVEATVVASIRALPSGLRYYLTLVAFWPTLAFNRVYCLLFPSKRRLWDRVHANLVVGSAPLLESEIEHLYAREGVRAVVNLCREWDGHGAGPSHGFAGVSLPALLGGRDAASRGVYARLGVPQLRLPTIDFDPPTLEHLLRGAAFIRAHALRGSSVYVHCKAGRGRSVAVCLAYLVLYDGLAPHEADARMRLVRPHISSKWKLPSIQALVALRESVAARGVLDGDAEGNDDEEEEGGVKDGAGATETTPGRGRGRKVAPAPMTLLASGAPSSSASVPAPEDQGGEEEEDEGERGRLAATSAKTSRSDSATRRRGAGAGSDGGVSV